MKIRKKWPLLDDALKKNSLKSLEKMGHFKEGKRETGNIETVTFCNSGLVSNLSGGILRTPGYI